jgi:adenylate cyclase
MDGDDRDRLMRRLRAAGCSDDDLERAAAEDRLPTLAVELALGETTCHTLTAAARAAAVDHRFFKDLMEAIGRPRPAPREAVFTDDDIELAQLAQGFVDAGLGRDEVLDVGRVMSLGMSHTAEAVRRVVGDAYLEPGDSEFTVGLRYANAVDELAPLVPRMLATEFRTQLRHAVRQYLVTGSELEAGRLDGTRDVAIAFADLVDYTRLGESLDADAIGNIAGELVALSTRAAAPPVTLVKTIGDAAMFVSPDVEALVDAMSSVVAAVDARGPDIPAVRIGIAYGPATNRYGDWYGSTVNLASRVTDAGRPSRILATEEVKERSPSRDWKRKRRLRTLKGISDRLRLFSLSAGS